MGRGWGLTEGCHGRGFRGNVGGGGGVEEGARAKYARAWRPGLQGDAGSEGWVSAGRRVRQAKDEAASARAWEDEGGWD